MSYKKGNCIIFLLAVLFIFFPWFCSFFRITLHLAAEILIFSIFTLGFNILLGYTGAVSFGHAAFFGSAAYLVGFSQKYFIDSVLVSIVVGTLGAGVLSLALGALIIRKHGIYFSLLTMAFGQVFYFLCYRFTYLTGGENGFGGIKPPSLQVEGWAPVNFENPLMYYYLVLVLFIGAMAVIWRVINSPFGKIIQGIKENEKRVTFLGHNTNHYRLSSFVLSSLFAGLAGSLYAILLRFAFPQMLHWTTSGDVVIMCLIGGTGNFFGPIVGAATFMLLRDIISAVTERWMIIVGSIFILFVILSPEGILGLFRKEKKEGRRFLEKLKPISEGEKQR